MRIVFMGTPAFSTPTLQALVDAGHDVVAVYTQPPRPANRGKKETKSPVHELADQLGLPVYTPHTMKDEAAQREFADLDADVGIVIAFGQILPRTVLDAPKHGCLNLHASLLPRWRGAAPIQRAIMSGDRETGVMVMQMEKGLDTGPVSLTSKIEITPNMTAGELHDVLQVESATLAVEALNQLTKGNLTSVPQASAGLTYAHKIEKSETRIDWNKDSDTVHNHIRGLSPFPGAWFEIASQEGGGSSKQPERVKVLACEQVADGNPSQRPAGEVLDENLLIACQSGAVRLTKLQRAGKRAMDADDFQRGAKIEKSTVLAVDMRQIG